MRAFGETVGATRLTGGAGSGSVLTTDARRLENSRFFPTLGGLDMAEEFTADETSRREVLKRGLFVAPAILTLAAVPSFASAGSGNDPEYKKPKHEYKKPKKKKEKEEDD
jgi:hypothetical protein